MNALCIYNFRSQLKSFFFCFFLFLHRVIVSSVFIVLCCQNSDCAKMVCMHVKIEILNKSSEYIHEKNSKEEMNCQAAHLVHLYLL